MHVPTLAVSRGEPNKRKRKPQLEQSLQSRRRKSNWFLSDGAAAARMCFDYKHGWLQWSQHHLVSDSSATRQHAHADFLCLLFTHEPQAQRKHTAAQQYGIISLAPVVKGQTRVLFEHRWALGVGYELARVYTDHDRMASVLAGADSARLLRRKP